MKKLLGSLAVTILSTTLTQAANPHLLKSTPADGGVTATPPSFVLEYSQPVHLHDLTLKRDDEKRPTPISNLPSKEATAFTIPAPSLMAGGYVLEWTVFTQSAAFTGHVRFTVSPGQAGTTATTAH